MNTKPVKVFIIILAILSCTYWKVVNLHNVYATKIGGMISEMLWLPMLILLFGLPIFSLIMWIKDKFRLTSLYFIALLISVLTIVWMVL